MTTTKTVYAVVDTTSGKTLISAFSIYNAVRIMDRMNKKYNNRYIVKKVVRTCEGVEQ